MYTFHKAVKKHVLGIQNSTALSLNDKMKARFQIGHPHSMHSITVVRNTFIDIVYVYSIQRIKHDGHFR
jgi:hypothetical protein